MSGVSGMNYMYSLSASSGGNMSLYVDFQLGTDVNTDQILAQMRSGQANAQLPSQVTQQGVIVQPGDPSPFMLIDLFSPNGNYDNIFLANYATINLQYALTASPVFRRFRSSAPARTPCASGSILTGWPVLA